MLASSEVAGVRTLKALALALLLSVVIATPAASGATSLARAKRIAAKALAPQTVTGTICVGPILPSRGRRVDKWSCIVWVTAPAGQECHAIVDIRKGRAKITAPVTCNPLPSSPDDYEH